MAPKREIKKRMGKKHRQASTRPKLGKGPAKGARKKGSAVTGAVAPKNRKKLATKRAAEEKAARTPTRSPEFEHRIIVGDMEEDAPRKPQLNTTPNAQPANETPAKRAKSPTHEAPAHAAEAKGQSRSESKRKTRKSVAEGSTPDTGEDRESASFSADLRHRRTASSQDLSGLPLVAICGRPNVGKSTLFNRFTGTRRSIVGDEPGITRDRIYGEVEWGGRNVRLVDTGGVIPDDEALIPSEIFRQARVALDEASAIIMVIDGRTEITAADQEFSRILIRGGKPLFLAVNKTDSPQLEARAENFRTLGFRNVFPVSAEHGSGIGDLLDAVWEVLPPEAKTPSAGPGATEAGAPSSATASPSPKVGSESKVGSNSRSKTAPNAAPDTEEPYETLDTLSGEASEDEGDNFADRAALVPRAMRSALLAGEAATADEPAGIDAPPIGEPDYEAPTGGSGQEPQGFLKADFNPADFSDIEAAEDETGDLTATDDPTATPAELRERKLRSHGEHISRETRIAIIGRPNVGKSTLLNALTGTERAIVSPIAGTTRDAVDEVVTRDGHDFRFIDTAGIRRKGKTTQLAEKLSVIMSRKHLEAADVALLLIDATEGVTGSDANIGGYAHESGRSVIIVVNKWDLVAPPKHLLDENGNRAFDGKPPADKKAFEEQVRYHLKYLDYAPLVFVSASEGQGIDQVFKKVELVARERRKRVTTGNMNRFLDKVDFGRASVPMNRRVRIYYMTQAAVAPPTFVLFTDRDVKLHFSYERFLSNEIRKAFKFIGSPIWFKIKARNKKKEE